MTNDVNLGIGAASGMFYTAPAGTQLPEYPSAPLTQDVYTQCTAASVYDANEDYYTKSGDTYTKATVTEETFNANKTDYYTKAVVDVWTEVGSISADGITWSTKHDFESLKNWANQIERMLPSDDSPTVNAPIIDTTESSLGVVFGADNIKKVAATEDHGEIIYVDVNIDTTSEAKAYLFIGRDGDDMFMLGTSRGFLQSLDDISFAPGDPITWNATIAASTWRFAKDNGQVVTVGNG